MMARRQEFSHVDQASCEVEEAGWLELGKPSLVKKWWWKRRITLGVF